MAHAPPPLGAEETARSERVVDRLREAAGGDGFLPFDRFMEIALYDEADGFYSRRRSPLGKSGDFYTAPHVHPVFGAAIARRICEIRKTAEGPGPFRIVELGPGDGTLAATVLAGLGGEPTGLEYVLVERSEARGREAEERARTAPSTVPVRRAASLSSLGPSTGVVLANEFLDAQPARRLRWDGSRWHEIGVRVRDGRLDPAESEISRSVPGPALPAPTDHDVVVEVSPAGEGYVREIADHLADGIALLIDYGLEESTLLGGHPRGTLTAVRDHGIVSDPLDHPGASDLSTFVNFTRLRSVAKTSGLVEVAYRSQAEALGDWGFPGLLEAAVNAAPTPEAKVRIRLAAKNLLFGWERFRVLELAAPRTGDRRTAAT